MNRVLIALLSLVTLFTLAVGVYSWSVRASKIDATNYQSTNTLNKEDSYFKENRGKIVYSPLGDSLTEGYYATEDSKKFSSVLSSLIEEKMGFEVKEDGIGNYGGKVSKGLEMVSKVSEKNPDIVTIEYGTNDSSPKNGEVDVIQFESDLNDLIDELTEGKEKPPLIILVTTWNQWEKAIPFDEAIKKVAEERGYPVVDIDHIWRMKDTKGPAGLDTPFGPSDDWHPNDKGMEMIAQEIYNVSAEYINKIDE
ncbi:SGNH/GDSL hydrolase family protein [Rossellomorea sp. FS2]|uniref:SGNH/GDSL hydrolase family protein n=1 Tax=Rossellomorea sp. FS2 TaxID=3391447 RepID=UPI003A4D5A06